MQLGRRGLAGVPGLSVSLFFDFSQCRPRSEWTIYMWGGGKGKGRTAHINSGESRTLPWRFMLILRMNSSPMCFIISRRLILTFPVVATSWGIDFVSSIV